VTSDLRTGKDGEEKRKGEGDGFMVAAATLLGIGEVPFSLIYQLSRLVYSQCYIRFFCPSVTDIRGKHGSKSPFQKFNTIV